MTDSLLTLWVLLVAANPAIFAFGPKEAIYIATLVLLVLMGIARGVRPTGRDIGVIAAFAGISAVHALAFGPDVIQASLGFLVRLLLALLAVRVVKDFNRRLVSAMVAVSLVSFVFYLPVLLGVDLASLLSPMRVPIGDTDMVHIGIHNFHTPEHAARNSGMFGEPGMFAGYLILAMLLLLGPETHGARKKWGVLLVALLTTLSTTGYIALVPLLVMSVLAKRARDGGRSKVLYALPAAVVVAAIAFVSYRTFPFIGEKIEHQVDQAIAATEGSEYNRIGNLLFDFRYIEERPVFGWSPRHTTRIAIDPDVAEIVAGQGNGLSGFAVRFGLAGFVLLAAFTGTALTRWYADWLLALMAGSALLVVLTGEQFLNAPLFLTLAFVSVDPADDGEAELAEPDALAREES